MLNNLRGSALIWAITLSSGSCYLLFGYDQGVLGGLVSQPSFLEAIGNPNASFLGTIVALYNVGCLAGCISAAIWGNKFGRRNTILVGNAIMIVGAIIQTATYGSGQLIAGRLISGLGNGLNTSTIPVYVSETARSHRRGRMVAVQLSIVIFGIVFAYWLDYGTINNLEGEVVWRFPIAFQIVFALITMVTMPFLPETPRWLYSHDRKDEAVTVLARLMDTTEDYDQVQFIKNEMEESLELERQQGSITLKGILSDKTELKPMRRLLLCFFIQFFQQFSGVNAVVFFVTIILEQNVGLSSSTASLAAGFIQMGLWIGTLPTIFYIDSFGRRPTLLIGSVVQLISLVLFTVGIAKKGDNYSNLALAMLVLFQITVGMTWCTVPWIYAPEITPLRLRHIGAAIGPFSEWLCTFIIVQITPTAVEHTGWKIFLLFILLQALSIPWVYFFVPETAKKTLEEIDYIFVKGEARDRLHERVHEQVQVHQHTSESKVGESQTLEMTVSHKE
ncbi:uncharacterized protein Z520_09908 [Fonsecaea multimorphosa CBS 102226]|uniref:Major facilitator superfamily (MFS) profile domain-containing protein n=1 Tax=Fonsecaea multimorphosa CBS 102226 TaxID=1442371 RepID=A0A0D2JMI8_9EURO|nr:uncharacterized protein Z520_09908 [Fonsecaea multimorphosa CBS 102226]KIX94522.1 hypothetical protein Z520_09908 [Fonsecaea multimorphosa CBS 102226]